MHGGGPPVTAGKPLDQTYKSENVELVQKGCCNLAKYALHPIHPADTALPSALVPCKTAHEGNPVLRHLIAGKRMRLARQFDAQIQP